MELCTNFAIFHFSRKCIFRLLSYLGTCMLGLRWMCMHLWLNLIKRTIDSKKKIKNGICTKSMESSIKRGRHTQLWVITSLKWIIQNVTDGFLKLLSNHPIHIVVWGNFPFNSLEMVCNQPTWFRLEHPGAFPNLSHIHIDLTVYSIRLRLLWVKPVVNGEYIKIILTILWGKNTCTIL